MNIGDNMIYWIIGLVVIGLIVQLRAHFLSPEVRERRRCRRNHRKVVSRARRPIVMLSARVPKS